MSVWSLGSLDQHRNEQRKFSPRNPDDLETVVRLIAALESRPF
jgi:hypothetical protein